jgi:pyroglutamyl-peptidase
MKILIYSFEKFQNLKNNHAYEVGKEITRKFNSKDVQLIKLPVNFNCWDILRNKIEEFKPDFVLGIGIAVGINKVKVEKVGLNYKHSEISDNEKTRATLEKINASKKLSYETNIDVLDFVDSLKKKEIPAEISFHAGTYVCNYTYYNCLEYVSDKNIKTLFIHIPASPKDTIELNLNVPCFPSSVIADGIFNILASNTF